MHRVAFVLMSGALLAAGCRSTSTQAPTADTGQRNAPSFIEGRWEALPLEPGVDDLVWSGRELLLYGRERDAAVGSIRIVDPTTNVVRTVTVPGPDRRGASTIWTGQELLVIGGQSTTADFELRDLAFAPATNNWRELAPSPLTARMDAPIAWTGHEAIVVAGFDSRPRQGNGVPALGAGAYDPTTDTWRTIAEPPDLTSGDGLINKALWTGTEVIVWGERRAALTARWLAYNPITDTWRELAPPPVTTLGAGRQAWAVHSHGTIIALGFLGQAAALDLAANQWQQLPDFLERKGLIVPQLITIADDVIAVLGQPRTLTADRSAWLLGPPAPAVGYSFGTVTRLAWTGRELYAVDVGGGFAKYIPPEGS